jgi:hypothetical protein
VGAVVAAGVLVLVVLLGSGLTADLGARGGE